MYMVILEDGTTYNIDTESYFNAESVVEYKLRQRLDYRKIQSVQEIKGVMGDKTKSNANFIYK